MTRERVAVMIFDASDPGAMMKFMRGPGTSDWQSQTIVKTRLAPIFDEAMKMLK